MILKQYVLSKMPKGKLQSMCREHNLPISGTRSSIITRLVSSTDWSQLQSKQPNKAFRKLGGIEGRRSFEK